MDNFKKIKKEIAQKARSDFDPVWFKTGKGEYSEHDKFLGVTVPELRLIAKRFPECSFNEISALITSPYNEERFLALILLINGYEKGDISQKEKIFDFYINNKAYVNNWNLVDVSAHKIIGRHIHEGLVDKKILHKMIKSKMMWERRIAIVATWYFIHNNVCSITFDLAETLLNDSEDLIHKAAGWMLREAGKKDIKALKIFLDIHSYKMPRTMLRYSIERFSDKDKKHYMGK